MNATDDFLNAFMDLPEETEDPGFDKMVGQYCICFGHVPPLEMVPAGISREMILAAMQWCIDKKQDELLDALGIHINEANIY